MSNLLFAHPSCEQQQRLTPAGSCPQSACLLLRVDDIVSARRPKEGGSGGGVQNVGAGGDGGEGGEEGGMVPEM